MANILYSFTVFEWKDAKGQHSRSEIRQNEMYAEIR